MRFVVLSLAVLAGGGYLAGTLGLLPEPLSHYFESDWERDQRQEREWHAQQIVDAEAGDEDAQFRYAVRLLEKDLPSSPDAVKHDPKAGIAMLEASAAQGHSHAMQGLAVAMLDGTFIPIDKQRIATLYIAVAKTGNDAAHALVGSFYARGWGVEKDETLATQYYLEAARGGVVVARSALVEMQNDGRLPDAMAAEVAGIAEIRNTDAIIFENSYELARMDRIIALDSPVGSKAYWMARQDRYASTLFFSTFDDSADDNAVAIIQRYGAWNEEARNDIERLAWYLYLEARHPFAKKGRADALAAKMSTKDISEAEAMAESATKAYDKWIAS